MSTGITGALRELRQRARGKTPPDIDVMLGEMRDMKLIEQRQHRIVELFGMMTFALQAGWVSREESEGENETGCKNTNHWSRYSCGLSKFRPSSAGGGAGYAGSKQTIASTTAGM